MTCRTITTGLAFGLASLIFASGVAFAGTGTATLTATTSVNTNCTIAATAVAFGTYDPIGANLTAALNTSGSITIACVKGTAPTIGLSLGNNASGSTRQMAGSISGFLVYELYQPPTTSPGAACTFPGTTVWGTAGANLFTPTAAPSKTARTYNVCGSAPAGQDPNVGTYSDTVVATVTF